MLGGGWMKVWRARRGLGKVGGVVSGWRLGCVCFGRQGVFEGEFDAELARV